MSANRSYWRAGLVALGLALFNLVAAAATLLGSSPADGAKSVSPDQVLELRFDAVLSKQDIGSIDVTLIGPSGSVAVAVSPGQESKVLQVKPTIPLVPSSSYSLLVGDRGDAGSAKARRQVVIGFATAPLADAPTTASKPVGSTIDQAEPGERFLPTADQRKGNWLTGVRIPQSWDAKFEAKQLQEVLRRLSGERAERLRSHFEARGRNVDLYDEATEQARRAKLQATVSSTSATVRGQVLRLNGKPLPGVSLRIGQQQAVTDQSGEFTLEGAPAGEQVLVIDGRRAAGERGRLEGRDFGRYEYRVYLTAGINELPHTIWLTPIDHQHAQRLEVPSKREVVVTHPDIPGLELRIPAGAVIRDADGQVVQEVSITPIPVDKKPFPMPYNAVGLYYTIQPGGARIESADGQAIGATIRYPNYSTQPPGAKFDLFGYDPRGRGWYTYAVGSVSEDGSRIESAQPFVVYQFAMSAASHDTLSGGPKPGPGPGPNCGPEPPKFGSPAPPPPPSPPGNDHDGHPVLCNSGIFVEQNTDLVINDIVPLRVDREFRSGDTNSHTFGIGSNSSYDSYIYFEGANGSDVEAVLFVTAGGLPYRLVPAVAGKKNISNDVFVGREPGPFFGARFYRTGNPGFDLVKRDGSKYEFNWQVVDMWAEVDRWGNRTTVLRDNTAGGRIWMVVSPNGAWVEYQYGVPGCSDCVSKIVDHTGRFIRYDYEAGRLKTVTAPENTVTDFTYDSAHRMVTIKDPRRTIQVTNEYWLNTGIPQKDGRIKKQTYADASWKEFDYSFDAGGNITATEVKDQRGVIRRREYDIHRYVTKDVHAKGTAKQATWAFERDPNTHLVTLETDPLGRKTRFEYDGAGNQISRTAMYGTPQATTWQTTWEPRYNQPLVSTDPMGRQTVRVYDAVGLLLESHDKLDAAPGGPVTNRTTYEWYPNGQLKSLTRWPGVPDANKQLTTRFTYDAGVLKTVTDALNRTTSFNVDALGRVIGTRDAAGQLATLALDDLDRVTKHCDPSGACAEMSYDANGNLLQFKLGTTQRDFTYDAMNRMQTEGRNNGQTPATEMTTIYNPGSTTAAATKAVFESSNRFALTSYDELWRTAQTQVYSGSPLALKRTVSYTWDLAGRLQGIGDTVSGNLAYTYDDRFDSVQAETGPTGTLSYGYYPNGLRWFAMPTGGSAIFYDYDNASRLKTLIQLAGSGGAQPSSNQLVGFTYDDANRRKRLTLANGITLDYGWDDADQLTGMAWKQANGTAIGELIYGYDVLGRRTGITGSLARSEVPPAVNLTVGSDGRISHEDGVALAYDANGRLSQDAQYIYVWNDLGQLTEVRNRADNALRASYQYDAVGRRMQKTLDGQTTRYLHEGANPIQLQDASGTAIENLLAAGIDEWFSRTRGGQTQHFVTDALGSTLRLTDAAGGKVVDYRYDPYGGTAADAASTNVFQYTGRENDGLGLYFNRARYYKPEIGRFTSQDPIGMLGGDNIYGYVSGSPLGKTDPLGLAEYGTTDCSYYAQRCKTEGGLYYCHMAPHVCAITPDSTWTRCVRKCLQETDWKYCDPASKNTLGGSDTICVINIHQMCFQECIGADEVPPCAR